mgnify:CR=1 FL=1
MFKTGTPVILSYDGKNHLGVVTHTRYTKHGKRYDVRTEKGNAYTYVEADADLEAYNFPVPSILSRESELFASQIETNLFASNAVGHARANYADSVKRIEKVHIERRNNLLSF